MGVFLSPGGRDLTIKVEEKDGEVRLLHNGHAFARVYTDKDGDHIIDVADVDTGSVYKGTIAVLCWRR